MNDLTGDEPLRLPIEAQGNKQGWTEIVRIKARRKAAKMNAE
jgi:hypothetical protein